jgi:hypothetical protein
LDFLERFALDFLERLALDFLERFALDLFLCLAPPLIDVLLSFESRVDSVVLSSCNDSLATFLEGCSEFLFVVSLDDSSSNFISAVDSVLELFKDSVSKEDSGGDDIVSESDTDSVVVSKSAFGISTIGRFKELSTAFFKSARSCDSSVGAKVTNKLLSGNFKNPRVSNKLGHSTIGRTLD